MPLKYRIEERSSSLFLKIEEMGSPRRILYLDTLKSLAKEEDRAGVALLAKIHLRSPNASRNSDTVPFQHIALTLEQALEVIQHLSKTGRLHYNDAVLKYEGPPHAKLYWKGERGGALSAVLQWKGEEIPIEHCEKVFPTWCLWKAVALPFAPGVAWKWVEPFLRGPIFLAGAQLKKFLDEEPPIVWKERAPDKPLEVFPMLHLSDPTGCFANLWMDYPGIGRVAFEDLNPTVSGKARLKTGEASWEKDLLEAGYQRKIVGNSHYYCTGDKVRATLLFLLELGWKILDARERRIVKQTTVQWNVREERGKLALSGTVHFSDKSIPLKSAMHARGLTAELDAHTVGLVDVKTIEGQWTEDDALLVPKSSLGGLLPLLDKGQVHWEENLQKMAAGFKMGAALEASPPDPSFRGILLPYQQKGVDWLAFLHRWGFSALLADEMGLGKTVQVLAFFSRLRTNLPSLIVAPSSLLYQWKSELARFLPGVPVSIFDNKSPHFVFQGVVIASYATLRLDERTLSALEFEVIVLDESNAIKTASTQTARAASRLNGRFKIALTGTPLENRLEEVESQFRFLMPDLLNEKADLESLRRKIRPFLLRRKKQEVEIELPDKVEQIAWVEMSEAQAESYEAYRSKLRPQDFTNRIEMLEAILRLRQICCDPRLVGVDVPGTKIELLLQDLEGKKTLIFSQFTSMLSLIGKALREEGRDFLYLDGSTPPEQRAELVRRFQEEEETTLFLLSLKAGGVGLNLTAADYVLLFDPWWNEAVENQAIDRAHRIGQKKTVIAKRYLVPNSIEEKMLRLKEKKRGMAQQLLDGEAFSWTEEDLLHLLS